VLLRCAKDIVTDLDKIGLEVRVGVHAGEIELSGDDIGGIAVHIARRVSECAGAGEVVVSSTVRDLAVGSGIHFIDRGVQDLKGVPDPWRIYIAKLEGGDRKSPSLPVLDRIAKMLGLPLVERQRIVRQE